MYQHSVNLVQVGRGVGKSNTQAEYLVYYQQYIDQFAWCTKTFGKNSYNSWWYDTEEGFKFVDSKNELLFKLKWA
jgi:hypothetical protein